MTVKCNSVYSLLSQFHTERQSTAGRQSEPWHSSNIQLLIRSSVLLGNSHQLLQHRHHVRHEEDETGSGPDPGVVDIVTLRENIWILWQWSYCLHCIALWRLVTHISHFRRSVPCLAVGKWSNTWHWRLVIISGSHETVATQHRPL